SEAVDFFRGVAGCAKRIANLRRRELSQHFSDPPRVLPRNASSDPLESETAEVLTGNDQERDGRPIRRVEIDSVGPDGADEPRALIDGQVAFSASSAQGQLRVAKACTKIADLVDARRRVWRDGLLADRVVDVFQVPVVD